MGERAPDSHSKRRSIGDRKSGFGEALNFNIFFCGCGCFFLPLEWTYDYLENVADLPAILYPLSGELMGRFGLTRLRCAC